MKTPSYPKNETERINSLRSLDLLDTHSEERFDRLTRLAKRILDVPIALVSLIDTDRQWFKSNFGFSEEETSRDISFCGHTILEDELMLVPDALQDERFYDNPLVTSEPKIRFYAGYPLKGKDGHNLGTLCLIDTKPRQLCKYDAQALIDLAQMAQSELSAVQLATLDELTGISNRRGFFIFGEKVLDLCRRNYQSATLIYLDLNHFKAINDQYGHDEGDQVLKSFSSTLINTFRNSDVIARMGGDEFAVLLPESDAKNATSLIGRLQSEIDKQNEKLKYQIAFSAGIAKVDTSNSSCLIEAINKADQKMYSQKISQR